MKTSKSISRKIFHRHGLAQKFKSMEPLLRSELFSRARMDPHGKTLASLHKLSMAPTADWILARLAENENVPIEVRNLLEDAVKANRPKGARGRIDNILCTKQPELSLVRRPWSWRI